MKALHWDGSSLKLEADYAEASPGAGQARIRVRVAGVCSTDLQILRGYMGFTGVPGHEVVGEVEAGPPEWLGKRVVCDINFACRACPTCKAGLHRHCPTRTVLGILNQDGAFAESFVAPLANLHAVPDAVEDEVAVFAEPLAAAFSIVEQVDVRPDHEVVVLGDGKLGLLCAQALHTTGAKVTLVGKHDGKLGIAQERGIRVVQSHAFEPKLQFDVAVEATGSAAGLGVALGAVRPRGTLVLKSTVAAEHTLSLAPLVINELHVVGSRCGLFEPALSAMAEGSVATKPLIHARYGLDQGLEAVETAKQPGVLKVLIHAKKN